MFGQNVGLTLKYFIIGFFIPGFIHKSRFLIHYFNTTVLHSAVTKNAKLSNHITPFSFVTDTAKQAANQLLKTQAFRFPRRTPSRQREHLLAHKLKVDKRRAALGCSGNPQVRQGLQDDRRGHRQQNGAAHPHVFRELQEKVQLG